MQTVLQSYRVILSNRLQKDGEYQIKRKENQKRIGLPRNEVRQVVKDFIETHPNEYTRKQISKEFGIGYGRVNRTIKHYDLYHLVKHDKNRKL